MYSAALPNSKPNRFTHIAPTLSAGQYIALAILTIAFWLLTHPYIGIWHDAILYTAQALKILYPEIYQGDVFFQYGSQASFTSFPVLHAWLIERIGVDNSAFLITIIGQALFFTGSITLARHFLTPGQTIIFLIFFTTLPVYSNPILYIFEVFATSRSITAGLSLLFLAFFLKKRFFAASAAITCALPLHPIMPLGAIAIAVFHLRFKVTATIISIGIASLIVFYTLEIPPISLLSLTIDSEWRDLVFQRSPFLFIEHWTSYDKSLLLLEISIILSARAYCTDKLKALFNATLISSAACLLISLAGSWFSNALLIQLQTWRIILFVHIISAIAFAWLVSAAWNKTCGKLMILFYCSIFLTLNTTGGLPALVIHAAWAWCLKRNVTPHPLLLKGAYLILAQGVFWYALNTLFNILLTTFTSHEFSILNKIAYHLKGSSFFVTATLISLLLLSKRSQKSYSRYLGIAIIILAPTAIYLYDQRFRNETWDDGEAEPYITLREEIPKNTTVYFEQGVQACWFMLRRQQYMSPYQTAGIVFSRGTAVESKRRADLLFKAGFKDGIFPRDWKHMAEVSPPEPTLGAFNALCQDPALDYVITKDTSIPKTPDKTINSAGILLNVYSCFHINEIASQQI
jgi:hypothetical protein